MRFDNESVPLNQPSDRERCIRGYDLGWARGRYGDLSGDGNFDAPGSEHATTFNTGSEYTACAICIMKSVKVYSNNGAAVTTIQVGTNPISPTTVYVAARDVAFGAPGHGFTITWDAIPTACWSISRS